MAAHHRTPPHRKASHRRGMWLVHGAHRVYRATLSPLFGNACRFHPTCSEYAVESVEHHGYLRGSLMALGRILRCNPWHPGGLDPVPPAGNPVDSMACSPGSGAAPEAPVEPKAHS